MWGQDPVSVSNYVLFPVLRGNSEKYIVDIYNFECYKFDHQNLEKHWEGINMIILIDGVRYRLVSPENEASLEKAIQSNCKQIFGPDSFYFDKKKLIKSRAGVASIPDGYVIFFDPNPKWCILEVELTSHSIYDHLIPQLTKFNRGIEDSSTRKKLVEIFYETITDDELLKAKLKQKIGSGEIYKFLSDLILEAPLIVVAIDQRTAELEEALRDIRGEVKVLEFKTFQREGISDQLNAYAFEPIVKTKKKIKLTENDTSIEEVSRVRSGIGQAIYELFNKKGIENVTYEECEVLAKQIKPDTKFNYNHFSWYKNQYRKQSNTQPTTEKNRGEDFGEEFHIKGKPYKMIELFRSIDKFCFDLDANNVQKNCHKKYIKYSHKGNIFCTLHIWNSLIRVWLKLDYKGLHNPPECVRDVTNIGHWGVGDVEVAISTFEELETAKRFVKQSLDENR
jgi:predicted transport protein